MSKLKKKITTAAKKGIAKQIGKQFKKIIAEKVDSSDAAALNYAQKYAEHLALKSMGEGPAAKTPGQGKTPFPETTTKKNKKFKIKIKGMGKVAKDVLNGKDTAKAIKDNAGVFVNFKFEW